MYTFPFTEDSVKEEICGRTMVVGFRRVGGNEMFNPEEVVLRPATGANGINWSVVDGVLHLEDERGKTTHEIDCVGIVNGKVCLGGHPYRTAGVHGNSIRVLMYERAELGTDFHVVISSHVDYEEVALPRLIRSLARVGIPENRVTAVIGGDVGVMSQEKGYRRVPIGPELLGSTAIEYLVSDECDIDSGYVVLLHDTCEVLSDFEQAVRNLDVGMPFDVYWFWNEIGLWSMKFIRRVKAEGFERRPPHTIPARLIEMASLVRKSTRMEQRKAKDVYGQGVTRTVFEFPELDMKKYVGRDMTGGRP